MPKYCIVIASQVIGKDFMGALDYNRKKLDHSDIRLRAEILDSNFASFDYRMIKAEIEAVRQLRPNLNRYVYHTSLNFSVMEMESLNNEKLLAIAHEYLNELGYSNNQYLIFRHYDASHPHLHLLVNRITFDGGVVSDSNNYRKSEAVVRMLEAKYNLIPVDQSIYKAIKRGNDVTIERNSHVSQRALKKNEIEKALRTGKPSDKMVLQEKLSSIIKQPGTTFGELISKGEAQGIYFLFNQASTGYISGITYFHNDFKAKGQALGNRFKWAELIKYINYEQDRDRQEISAANERTIAKYGDITRPDEQQASRHGNNGLHQGSTANSTNDHRQPAAAEKTRNEVDGYRARSLATDQDAVDMYRDTAGTLYHDTINLNILIADDIDDEAIHGRNRRRKGMARTNTR